MQGLLRCLAAYEAKLDRDRLRKLLEGKFKYKGIEIKGLEEIFPPGLPEILGGYWERELGRLIFPVPEMEAVIHELESRIKPLLKPVGK